MAKRKQKDDVILNIPPLTLKDGRPASELSGFEAAKVLFEHVDPEHPDYNPGDRTANAVLAITKSFIYVRGKQVDDMQAEGVRENKKRAAAWQGYAARRACDFWDRQAETLLLTLNDAADRVRSEMESQNSKATTERQPKPYKRAPSRRRIKDYMGPFRAKLIASRRAGLKGRKSG